MVGHIGEICLRERRNYSAVFDLGLNAWTRFHISAQNKYESRKTAEMKVETMPAL